MEDTMSPCQSTDMHFTFVILFYTLNEHNKFKGHATLDSNARPLALGINHSTTRPTTNTSTHVLCSTWTSCTTRASHNYHGQFNFKQYYIKVPIVYLSATFPISPPSASTSCTSWDFAGPPTAGLQGCIQFYLVQK